MSVMKKGNFGFLLYKIVKGILVVFYFTLAISILWSLGSCVEEQFFPATVLCNTVVWTVLVSGFPSRFSLTLFLWKGRNKEAAKSAPPVAAIFESARAPVRISTGKHSLIFFFFNLLINRSSSAKKRACLANECPVTLHLINIVLHFF